MKRGMKSIIGVMTAVFCLLGIASSAVAQQQPFTPPEALIIVQPTGNQAIVTVSYSGKVSHAAAKQAMERLAKLGRWKMSAPEISDVDMRTNQKFGAVKNLGVQTGATATISGAPLAVNGGFLLQPFVDTFRDLASYKLFYWVGPQPGFQGLRSFDSPAISVELTQEGGPYRYTITNHTRQGAAPQLPLIQARTSTVASVAGGRPSTGGPAWSAVGPVIAIAVGSGLFVFLVLRLLARARGRSRNRTAEGRTTPRDSRYTSQI
jgi:hypothetical protein